MPAAKPTTPPTLPEMLRYLGQHVRAIRGTGPNFCSFDTDRDAAIVDAIIERVRVHGEPDAEIVRDKEATISRLLAEHREAMDIFDARSIGVESFVGGLPERLRTLFEGRDKLNALFNTPENGRRFFPMTAKPPCPTCRQPEGVILDVGVSGFMVSSGYEHLPECPALRCPHGVRWQEDCAACDENAVPGNGEE